MFPNKNNNNVSLICQSTIPLFRIEEGGTSVDIKSRMAEIGMSQVDMILELQKRGYTVQPPMLSCVLRGIYTYPKAKQILAVCEEIINEHH